MTKTKRRFIDDLTADSYIKYSVKLQPKSTYTEAYIDSELKIADCHRTVTLDFGVSTYGSSLKNRQVKLNRTRAILNEYFDLLQEYYDRYALAVSPPATGGDLSEEHSR